MTAALDAVLFDLDGVLVDSLDAWHAVVNEVRRDLALPPVTLEAMRAVFGQGVEDDAANLFVGHAPSEIGRRYDAAFPRHLDALRVGPGTHAVLEALGARGIRRAVVTNTQHGLAREILARTGLDAHVDVLSGAGATSEATGRALREKPHPDLLQEALRRLGDLAPSRARMVGDTDYDARAADRAGVPFLHFDLREQGTLQDRLAPWLGEAPLREEPS